MEHQIIELIEEEVNRRVALRVNKSLEVISKLYDIPLARLVQDTADIEVRFCQGVLKNKKRCLKEPQHNGYCLFHQKQIPVVKVHHSAPNPVSLPSPVTWGSAPVSRLNI